MTEFSLEVFQNEFVSEGATTMDAIVTVTARGGTPPGPGEAAEVLIIDTSGSMSTPPARILAARQAARDAIDAIRDGVLFAVVSGSDRARMVFPTWGASLAMADPASRAAAKEAVGYLEAGGGTAMSTWLLAARDLFVNSPASLRHAIFLTDGDNWEDPWLLEEAIGLCRGLFQVDCRGVGTDWVVSELRTIASALLGTVDLIPEPEMMAAEFRSLMEAAMGRAVAMTALEVWCPQGAGVNFIRQVAPDVEDLTGRGTQADPRTVQYSLGAWGAEARDYHLQVSVPPNEVGVEMLAARLRLVADGTPVGQGVIRTVWTDDVAASARIDADVAHYTGQATLSASIQEGLEALKGGDERTATVKLGQATRLAVESGHEGTVRLLKRVVHVEDERTGTVRVRRNIAKVDEMALDTQSTRTVRVRRDAPRGEAMMLDTRSSRTMRVRKGGPAGPAGGAGGPTPGAAGPGDDDPMLDARSSRTMRVHKGGPGGPTPGAAGTGGPGDDDPMLDARSSRTMRVHKGGPGGPTAGAGGAAGPGDDDPMLDARSSRTVRVRKGGAGGTGAAGPAGAAGAAGDQADDDSMLDMRSSRTVRVRKGPAGGGGTDGGDHDEETMLDTHSTRTVRVGGPKPPGDAMRDE